MRLLLELLRQVVCPRVKILQSAPGIIARFCAAVGDMDLILQGNDIETGDLKTLAKLTGARGIEQVTPGTFRLMQAQQDPAVPTFCEGARLDYGYVPPERRLTDYRLLVMDMDSTLITIETIDELADLVGLKTEVAAITEAAMRGEIEYNESLRQRVAVLKGLGEDALQRVFEERVKLTPGAEKLLAAAQRAGVKTLLVSGGFTYVTDRLQTRLKLDYARSNCLELVDGKLTGGIVGEIVNADGKREALLEVRDRLGIAREQIIGIGDGANDLKFMAECGVSIAYHAKPIVRGQTTYALNYVDLSGVLPLFNAQ
jgi:phosphoserine phosphatase